MTGAIEERRRIADNCRNDRMRAMRLDVFDDLGDIAL
jgi:hypothetical protein